MAQTSLIAGFRVHETGVTPREVIPLGKGELILVVDDEAAIRDIARQVLESYGYRVATAGDGTEAVAVYVQNKTEIRATITSIGLDAQAFLAKPHAADTLLKTLNSVLYP